MIVSPTTPLLHARRRALVAATLALGAMILGLGAAPAVASESQTSNVVAVSSALASNPGLSTTVTATIGDSLAKANEVLGAIRPMTLVGFNPGNIISDAVFYNSNSMTEAQIQAFLNSKVPKCQSGFVCLRDYKLTTTVRAASPLCAAYVPAANEPAARIIFRVAQACGINPQVILVTLQKEQGLVAHTSPSADRFKLAMGQGCPDTAACDVAYYGFFNQVYGAAAQLKRYSNPPGTSNYFTWFAPGKTWNVQFHPDKACGSTPVYIENQATANLYYYTPYQPNAAAIAAGYGDPKHPCASFGNRNFYNYFTDWFGSTKGVSQDDPFGNVELLEAAPGVFRVVGWAGDRNSSSAVQVQVRIGSQSVSAVANLYRPDVGQHYPELGSNRGYSVTVPAFGPGTFDVCVDVNNLGAGTSRTLLCERLTALSGPPVGAIDEIKPDAGGIDYRGWALDRDTVDSIPVHLYLDGQGTAITANGPRPDLVPHYPQYGPAHGFSGRLAASPGAHTLCAYGINTGAGENALIRCETVRVPGQPDLGRAPIGNLESIDLAGNVAVVKGWALDPDTDQPIEVHVYVDSAGIAYAANGSRPDVGRAYPGYGDAHGYLEQIALPAGRSKLCIYAINSGPGDNTTLGCRELNVAQAEQDLERIPFGNVESLVPQGEGIVVTGWAIDPDTVSPISVHVYVGGVGYATTANLQRADVGRAYPASGPLHGFVATVPAAKGKHRVCVYLINVGKGDNPNLACYDVIV